MWVNNQTAVLIGAFSGALVGALSAIWGMLAGLFARNGRYKKLVLTYGAILSLIGICLLTVGVIALIKEQPYALWYGMLISGLVTISVVGPSLFIVRHIYDKLQKESE